MQVWAIIYDKADFPDSLYQNALPLVDPTAQTKIKKFYRREDACRSLIGCLLPRVLLKKRGVDKDAMQFAATETGKPYVTTPGIEPPLGFNVTHDEGVVAMAFGTGDLGPPAFNIGVDVMKLKIPPRSTFASFVDSVSSQLTAAEHDLVLADVTEDEAIRRFFWIWTLKEAYTKALGIGLGFDFKRIEFDVTSNKVTIDGEVARGWQFLKFEISQSANTYVGVAAKFIGGRGVTISDLSEGCLVCYDAVSFVDRAIEELN
ncbi:4'-phosphopantetheinyl transferase superfamily [Hygrophoropsis aurantiaca]|uniref:4'-phosphopantetheinyl transferase superfamily n=1 Tax=Hygrophoropsis aurantiaca TaxID=72124 RepID=A0ACB8AV60_9AGAM|nr:4'-phosphopantetheinyl transferase superfamily [Hygrophoropsis aurantiaca]